MIVKSIVIVFFVMSAQMAVASWHSFSFDVMGTRAAVDFWLADAARAKEIASEVEAEMRRIESVMSPYIDTSELSVVNSGGNAKHAMSISQELYSVIETAQRVSVISEGVFDVSFASVGFLYDYRNRLRPAAEQLERALQAVDYRSIDISTEKKGSNNRERYFIRFLRDDMRIDLGGIAKGYAVDQLAELLVSYNIENFLVEIGGEMRLSGNKANNESWKIAIEKPESLQRSVQKIISIGNNAIATSGDYRNYYAQDGVRYSHLINPTTGYPITHNLVSVTVVHPSSMTADGLATALNVIGKDKALAIADKYNFAVLLITKEKQQFKEYTSDKFEQLVTVH